MKRVRVRDGECVIESAPHRATVLHVIERDSDGTPRLFRLVRDDESVDISSGKEAFEIVYARIDLQKRKH